MSPPNTATQPPHTPSEEKLRTVSLRRRVILFSLAVLGVVLLLVSTLSLVFFGVQSRADINRRMTEATMVATQLAARNVPPEQILARITTRTISAVLVTPDGRTYYSRTGLFLHRPPGRSEWDGPGDRTDEFGLGHRPWLAERRSANEPGPPDHLMRRATLPNGSVLTLHGDVHELNVAQQRLRQLLMLLGIGGLGTAALALLITTRVALRPLDAMTALARSIAAGDRGRRLAPTRPNTELGRTAAAFDDMLDALEGAERAARRAEATARDSEARTRRFVADAAHELRTPIAGLRAAAEAALRSQATGEERERLQLLLIREAGRAGRLVEDLLSMAQIDAGLVLRREPVDLHALIEAEAERARLLSPNLTITVTGAPLTVSGDPQRLSQVLTNLLNNARRYTPDGGEISISLDREPATGAARIRVADTGPGVPVKDRERIFDRLVRLDEARDRTDGGAGLGLAIARGIARAHGGELRCVEDSVFELTLPAADSPS